QLQRHSGNTRAANGIRFELDTSGAKAVPGSYTLEVAGNGVTLRAADAAGLFNASMSLLQMLTAEADARSVSVPAVRITDAPRFSWRGFMLDSARHFQSVEQIKLVLDAMALHKLNTFHWHLTDDQGWRMEIK